MNKYFLNYFVLFIVMVASPVSAHFGMVIPSAAIPAAKQLNLLKLLYFV